MCGVAIGMGRFHLHLPGPIFVPGPPLAGKVEEIMTLLLKPRNQGINTPNQIYYRRNAKITEIIKIDLLDLKRWFLGCYMGVNFYS